MNSAAKILYKHRTRGQDVERVHIDGMSNGFRGRGYSIDYCSPPAVAINDGGGQPANKTASRFWNLVARKPPTIVYEFMTLAYNFVAGWKLFRMTSNEYQFIYERYAFFDASTYLISKFRKLNVVLEVNGAVNRKDPTHARPIVLKRLASFLEHKTFSIARLIVVVSSSLKDSLVDIGIPEEKILVLPNAVELDEFDNTMSDADYRNRFNLAGKTVIGFVGSFTFWHKVGFLVQSLAARIKSDPNVHLLLIGDGPDRSKVEEQVNELGISERVSFAGKIPHAEIPAAIAAMDIGVMPHSNDFGSPMKIFEYMAMAKPTVAAKFRPIAEVINHGQNGLLFEPENREALLSCVSRLVDDPELRQRLGQQARLDVEAKHTWDANCSRLLVKLGAEG